MCRDAEVAQQVPRQVTQLPEIKMHMNIRPVTRFLQWNADGVLNSWYELELFLEEEDIDVCCVQETKLRPTDRVPRMKNYVVVRKDRMVEGGARGGGLLILIRTTITYRKCSSEMLVKNPGMECLSVQLPTKDGTPLKVTNIYIPPSTSPVLGRAGNNMTAIELALEEGEIIMADMNAHDALWDEMGRSNERGESVVEQLMDCAGVVLNDGRPTRIDPIRGVETAPDITIVRVIGQNSGSFSIDGGPSTIFPSLFSHTLVKQRAHLGSCVSFIIALLERRISRTDFQRPGEFTIRRRTAFPVSPGCVPAQAGGCKIKKPLRGGASGWKDCPR